MMKICILVSDIFKVGGCERVAVNLANGFCEKHTVCLISGFNRGQKEVYDLDPRIDICYLVSGSARLRKCYFNACKKLNKILHRFVPDVTLLINSGTYVFLPAFWNVNTKCVACEHTNLNNIFHTSSFVSKFERLYAVLKCDRIVTLTESDKINYIKKYHISMKKVQSIYNWVDPEALKYFKVQDGQNKRIISVGRFDPVKGYEMLVDIAKEILNKHTDWEWHIYGAVDNGYKNKIQQMIKEYHLEKKLILKEPVPFIYEKYSQYSFLVLTSYFEGLPMVLLEAKACGLPVVSFSSPTGPDEIILDGINGYLVPCYDISFMVQRIEELINNRNKLIYFSENSQSGIAKFQKSELLGKWEQLFNDLIGER